MIINVNFDTEEFGKGEINIDIPPSLFELLIQPGLLQAKMIGALARFKDEKQNEDANNYCESASNFHSKNIDELMLQL